MSMFCDLMKDKPVEILTLIVSIITLFIAIYIPRKVFINQFYAAMMNEYKDSKIGEAVFAIFYFYTHDCNRLVSNIYKAYKNRYNKEIGNRMEEGYYKIDFSKTLHFQRRLIAQFYFNMATLRYDYFWGRISQKQMKMFFTPAETKLLSLLLHMAKPARDVFEKSGEIAEPQVDEPYLNKVLYRLYEEVGGLE